MKRGKWSFLLPLVVVNVLVVSCQFPSEGGNQSTDNASSLHLRSADAGSLELLDVRPDVLPHLDFSKVVFIGDSLCAGFQSNGLAEDTQVFSYPALVAGQLGIPDFEQPLIAYPGISLVPLKGSLTFDPATGAIFPRGEYDDPFALLVNFTLGRPYDNLGVPGARLGELLRTTSSDDNPFFNFILRGLGTEVDQARSLHPTLVVVWAGNNDVLAAATRGGEPSLITPVADFRRDFNSLIDEVRDGGKTDLIVVGIPDVADIPYVNAMDDHIFVRIPSVGRVPVVFDASFKPIDFDPSPKKELYIPLLTEEGGPRDRRNSVSHVLLPFVAGYQSDGLGVPDKPAIKEYLVERLRLRPAAAAAMAAAIEAAMLEGGLEPSGTPIPGDLTITGSEEQLLQETTNAYNRVIRQAALSRRPVIPVVSSKLLLNRLARRGVSGFSGKFVWFDPVNTAFSLDGVHPSNAGYGIVANALIGVMNILSPKAHIRQVDLEQFRGQYVK